MPSTKFKNKQRCTCHMKYEFDASCLTAANAAKIAAAFSEINFLVDTSQDDGVGLRLDDQKFFYRYAKPDFKALSVGEDEDPPEAMLHAVWSDVEQTTRNLVNLLFAATHHDPHWLATPEAQQVAGAFSASQFICNRFHTRLEEIASTVPSTRAGH